MNGKDARPLYIYSERKKEEALDQRLIELGPQRAAETATHFVSGALCP